MPSLCCADAKLNQLAFFRLTVRVLSTCTSRQLTSAEIHGLLTASDLQKTSNKLGIAVHTYLTQ